MLGHRCVSFADIHNSAHFNDGIINIGPISFNSFAEKRDATFADPTFADDDI
jgi:hypothetical protein